MKPHVTSLLLAAASVTWTGNAAGQSGSYLGPSTLAGPNDGKLLFVANADGRSVAVIDVARGECVRTYPQPAPPTGLAISPDGKTLFVTCGGAGGTVRFVDAATGEPLGDVRVGHTPMAPLISGDGKRLYVCNRFSNDISVIDTRERRESSRVRVTREPVSAALSRDERTLFVANHLPADPADGDMVSAVVSAIDLATLATASIRLPNGSTGVRDLCLSGDGKHIYVTHVLARYHLPTVQVERGWINTNALSIIDAETRELIEAVLLDEVNRGAANPWGVATTADGALICVSHAGTNELSVIDAAGMLAKIAARSADIRAARDGSGAMPIAARNDLTFLTGLRQRVGLGGIGPRGVRIVGLRAYVCEYFSDSLGVVSLEQVTGALTSAAPVGRIALGPEVQMSPPRRGEMLFNSAQLCLQEWQSCASCHPDARVDGLNWDLVNDGLGNPKNSKSMLLAHQTPPAMASGVRPGAKEAVRAGIRHIQFTVRPDEDADAIDAYLTSLDPVPSPYLDQGRLSDAARRGERVFSDPKVGCAECHPTPFYTDLKPYDVGSRGRYRGHDAFDTPTLIECWRTAPYMHDGQYRTVRELIEKGRHGATHGNLDDLTPEEIADLVEFVLSL